VIQPTIVLTPVFPLREGLIDPLVEPLKKEIGFPVAVESSGFEAEFALDISRQQYNSTAILAALIHQFDHREGVFLGITSGDLFIPVLTYVFGEAQLNGKYAIISSWRLNNELYGLEGNEKLLSERLLKEAIHELGHIFGLYHCRNLSCVMRSSTVVDEIDMKDTSYCARCKSLLTQTFFQS
jgi:archaemetzincin